MLAYGIYGFFAAELDAQIAGCAVFGIHILPLDSLETRWYVYVPAVDYRSLPVGLT